jgi:hypothetical protein
MNEYIILQSKHSELAYPIFAHLGNVPITGRNSKSYAQGHTQATLISPHPGNNPTMSTKNHALPRAYPNRFLPDLVVLIGNRRPLLVSIVNALALHPQLLDTVRDSLVSLPISTLATDLDDSIRNQSDPTTLRILARPEVIADEFERKSAIQGVRARLLSDLQPLPTKLAQVVPSPMQLQVLPALPNRIERVGYVDLRNHAENARLEFIPGLGDERVFELVFLSASHDGEVGGVCDFVE